MIHQVYTADQVDYLVRLGKIAYGICFLGIGLMIGGLYFDSWVYVRCPMLSPVNGKIMWIIGLVLAILGIILM